MSAHSSSARRSFDSSVERKRGSSTSTSAKALLLAAAAAATVAGISTTTADAAAVRPPPPNYPVSDIPIPQGAQLGMLVVNHRHGIRTPMLTSNTTSCPAEYGCGALTFEGKKMLASLGHYFADTYGIGGSGEGNGTPLNNGNGVIPTNAASPNRPNPNNIKITHYDPRSVRVVASSRDRAVQSGVGFLEGLYTNLNSANGCGGSADIAPVDDAKCSNPADFIYPLINNDAGDRLLYPTDGNQAFLTFQQAYNATMYPYMGNLTKALFTPEELYAMSLELQLGGGSCNNNATGTKPRYPLIGSDVYDPYVCGLDVQDDMKFLYATKGAAWLATNAPTVYSNMAKLDQCLNDFSYNYLYGYDADVVNANTTNGTVSDQSGYLGYPLAASIIADMKTVQPTAPSTAALLNPLQAQLQGVLRVKDYSSHDMTIMELTNAMGNYSAASFDAPFGVALFFEVWVTEPSAAANNADEDVSTRHIRAFYGYPTSMDVGSNYTYRFEPYAMVCSGGSDSSSSSSASPYAAPNGCPLADWERYMATRGPLSPAGTCYMSDETRAKLGCDHSVVMTPADALPINKTLYPFPTQEALNRQACYGYRQACPTWACARTSTEDYALIAAGSPDVPYALDQITNNCVRRFTALDEEALSHEKDQVDEFRRIVYGMVAVMLIVMFGFAGMILLLSVMSQSKKGGSDNGYGADIDRAEASGAAAAGGGSGAVNKAASSSSVEARSLLDGSR